MEMMIFLLVGMLVGFFACKVLERAKVVKLYSTLIALSIKEERDFDNNPTLREYAGGRLCAIRQIQNIIEGW